MKSFHYTNTATDLKKEIAGYMQLVNDLDMQIKSISDSTSVSRDSWRETQEKINKMRDLSKERDKYEKTIKQLTEQLKNL